VIEDSTITTVSASREHEAPLASAQPYLVVLTVTDDPAVPSSRHLLEHIDEVWFRRGPRQSTRSVQGGTRVLELSVPDPRMSSDHGKLLRGPAGWVIEDPRSKNGAVIDGVVTRRSLVGDGALIELGHTFFVFCVGRVEEHAVADRVDGDKVALPALTSFDGALADQFAALARIARTEVSVVILGETGTGKELIARALHTLSGRPGDFVAVNCGALPPALVEAELFGHRRGAFTGALGDRTGLVRSADNGTLFLDEIGELPPASQSAFLRVLQEREVTPVGSDRPVKVDVRLCAATLRDLSALVERGEFRPDLYGRLFGFTITLPPLRDRMVDLGILLRALLPRLADGRAVRLTPAALRVMLRHEWPLNIRELEKTLITSIALADENVIDLAQLPEAIRRPPTSVAASGAPASDGLAADDAALRARLVGLLTVHGGNVVAVGKDMNARRTQIYRWAHRFGIDIPSFRK